MAYRERGDLIAPAGEERIGTDDQRARPESEQGRKGRIDKSSPDARKSPGAGARA